MPPVPKSDLALLSSEYSPVAERVALFYARFPTGRIVTRLISRTERETIFRAAVYRTPDELEPAATGWAAEREGDGEINTSACLENTETSAIGRALANLGFAAVPVRVRSASTPDAATSRGTEGVARARPARGSSAAGVATHAPTGGRDRVGSPDLQARADSAGDLLALIRSAERSGLNATRAELLRRYALAVNGSADRHARLARVLRRWMARRVARELGDHASHSTSAK